MVEFWLGASETAATAQLDQAFFENWYGYQEDIMLRGVTPDPIQVMCVRSGWCTSLRDRACGSLTKISF